MGQGSAGHLHRMLNCATGGVACAEVLCLKGLLAAEDRAAALRLIQADLSAASRLDHPNLQRYSDRCALWGGELFVFTQEVDGETLEQILSACAHEGLPENVVLQYMRQILSALSYLHSQGVHHGGVFCENIFVARSGQVKLMNHWASSRLLRVLRRALREPSNLDTLGARQAWDVQCLGYVALCLLLGGGAGTDGSPAPAAPTPRLLRALASSLPASLPSAALSFIALCICGDDSGRASAQKLLDHPFIQGPSSSTAASPPPARVERRGGRVIGAALQLKKPAGTVGVSASGGRKSLTVQQARFLRSLHHGAKRDEGCASLSPAGSSSNKNM